MSIKRYVCYDAGKAEIYEYDDAQPTSVRRIIIMTDEDCYKKAKRRKQLTFTVVEQDLSAPLVILEWVKQNFYNTNAAKLQEALDKAMAMRTSEIKKKHPD